MDFYCGIEEVLVLLEKTKKRKNTNGELMSNILYNVKEKHKWLFEEKQNYIISNDVDGLLSGLLLQHCVNGSIVGVYDCKQLYVCKDIDVNDAIFVDIEIWRSQVRSIGHHMLCYSPRGIRGLRGVLEIRLVLIGWRAATWNKKKKGIRLTKVRLGL